MQDGEVVSLPQELAIQGLIALNAGLIGAIAHGEQLKNRGDLGGLSARITQLLETQCPDPQRRSKLADGIVAHDEAALVGEVRGAIAELQEAVRQVQPLQKWAVMVGSARISRLSHKAAAIQALARVLLSRGSGAPPHAAYLLEVMGWADGQVAGGEGTSDILDALLDPATTLDDVLHGIIVIACAEKAYEQTRGHDT